MILVNNPGDWGHIYAPLEHATWNGCTPTDLIFPFFLYIIGVSIVYAMETKKADPTQQKKLLLNVLRRTLILLFLAEFMSGFPFFNLHIIRIPGVLARISLVFGICGFLYLKVTRKTLIWLFWIFLASYYVIMVFIPVPGTGHASLQPETNMGAWLDRTVFGEAHLWKESKTWDPEGLLGTLPAVATGIFGILIGTWLKRKDRDDSTKVTWMFTIGILAVILGLLWDLFFPINKSLWTSSYVLYSGGLATIGLALFYWLIDVHGYNRFTKPFVVYGVNAITVFFLSGIIARSMNMIHVAFRGKQVSLKEYLFQLFFAPYFSPVNASLAGAIVCVLIWMGILWVMYNKKIIIKI